MLGLRVFSFHDRYLLSVYFYWFSWLRFFFLFLVGTLDCLANPRDLFFLGFSSKFWYTVSALTISSNK
eukprot:UN21991